jgi:serine/threonine protein phosphatase 1
MESEIVKRLHVIGDVHGCIDELTELIEKLDLQSSDELVMIGDLVDKNLEGSPKVIQYVRSLSEQHNVTSIVGNHEYKHLRYISQVSQGKSPQMRNLEEIVKIQRSLSKKDQQYMMDMPLWKVVKLHNTEYVIIHAGIPGHHNKLYPVTGKNVAEKKCSLQDLMFTRYERDGKMIMLGSETPEDKFWAEGYDGRFGFALFGHQPFIRENPPEFKNAIGLDTGCVYGGWLTAFTATLYDNDCIVEGFTQVKAHAVYSDHAKDYGKE